MIRTCGDPWKSRKNSLPMIASFRERQREREAKESKEMQKADEPLSLWTFWNCNTYPSPSIFSNKINSESTPPHTHTLTEAFLKHAYMYIISIHTYMIHVLCMYYVITYVCMYVCMNVLYMYVYLEPYNHWDMSMGLSHVPPPFRPNRPKPNGLPTLQSTTQNCPSTWLF